MTYELSILLPMTASIGIVHTLAGPDHYLPFVCMARTGRWSRRKTCWIVTSCAVGHVFGSVMVGLIAIGLGIALSNVEIVENVRGNLATWILIGFGAAYCIRGCLKATHSHTKTSQHRQLTPFILFLVFVSGPCEPLIPIMLFPAVKSSVLGILTVAIVFTFTTIITMVGMVVLLLFGIKNIKCVKIERYGDALGGALVLMTGLTIHWFNL